MINLCKMCGKEPLDSNYLKFCPACLRIRQAEQKSRYRASVRDSSKKNQSVRIALKEVAELKQLAKVARKKVRQILLTDEEQNKINLDYAKRSRANINIDIMSPAVRRIVQPAAWLWGAV